MGMKEILLDALLDTLKLCPFLFLSFGLIADFEYKFKSKSLEILNKTLKGGPLVGAALGVIPQCGFSVFATNLYSIGIITAGTLISVYLSTSDELLPILISSNVPISEMAKIIITKVVIAVVVGFALDFIIKDKKTEQSSATLAADDCCSDSILSHAVQHTLQTAGYILLITLVINFLIYWIGEETIAIFLSGKSMFAPFIASLIGLIPNCAASVIITELYLSKMIRFSSCIAGLLTGSGVAILVLFKVNKEYRKDNFEIVSILYFVGAISGLLLSILGL